MSHTITAKFKGSFLDELNITGAVRRTTEFYRIMEASEFNRLDSGAGEHAVKSYTRTEIANKSKNPFLSKQERMFLKVCLEEMTDKDDIIQITFA